MVDLTGWKTELAVARRARREAEKAGLVLERLLARMQAGRTLQQIGLEEFGLEEFGLEDVGLEDFDLDDRGLEDVRLEVIAEKVDARDASELADTMRPAAGADYLRAA